MKLNKHLLIASAIIGSFCTIGTAFAAPKPSFVADGTLTVCVDPTFPPMEFFAAEGDKAPTGFDIDLAKALASHWGVKPAFSIMDFNGLMPSLSAKRCDAVISGALLKEERLKTFDAVPYLNTYIVVVGKSGTPALKSLEDLSGKTVAIQSGTAYGPILDEVNKGLVKKGAKQIIIQQYVKQSDAIQQLLVGRAFGVVSQDTEVAYRSASSPGQFETIFTIERDPVERYGVYLPRNPEDTKAVAAAVSELAKSGKLGAIAREWKFAPKQIEGIGNE